MQQRHVTNANTIKLMHMCMCVCVCLYERRHAMYLLHRLSSTYHKAARVRYMLPQVSV